MAAVRAAVCVPTPCTITWWAHSRPHTCHQATDEDDKVDAVAADELPTSSGPAAHSAACMRSAHVRDRVASKTKSTATAAPRDTRIRDEADEDDIDTESGVCEWSAR